MKLALFSFVTPMPGYREYIELARTAGYDGVEGFCNMEFKTPDTEAAKRVRGVLDEAGMEMACFSLSVQVLAEPAAALARICAYADVAALLGAKYLHHTIGEPAVPGTPFSKSLRTAAQVVREGYDYAAARGLRVALEPQGKTMNGCPAMGELYAAADRPVGAVLDAGNLCLVDDDGREFIRRFGDRIVHVHLKDLLHRPGTERYPDEEWRISRGGEYYRHTVFGHGSLPLGEMFSMLAERGYDGWYAMECMAKEIPSYCLPQSAKNARAIYAEAPAKIK